MIRYIAVIAALITLLPAAAFAQGSIVSNDFYSNLSAINRVDPMQNPEYEPASKILGRKLIDNKNKVVGTVKDVVLTPNGTINALNADFDRLRLSNDVYLNYREMNVEPHHDNYQLAYRDSEIKDMYPQLLANIESAAGADEDTLSLSKMIGMPVRNSEGTRIGTVDSVLFGAEGSWAEALYINMSSGSLRGKAVAVPFGVVTFKQVGSQKEVALSKDQSEAIIQYFDKKRR